MDLRRQPSWTISTPYELRIPLSGRLFRYPWFISYSVEIPAWTVHFLVHPDTDSSRTCVFCRPALEFQYGIKYALRVRIPAHIAGSHTCYPTYNDEFWTNIRVFRFFFAEEFHLNWINSSVDIRGPGFPQSCFAKGLFPRDPRNFQGFRLSFSCWPPPRILILLSCFFDFSSAVTSSQMPPLGLLLPFCTLSGDINWRLSRRSHTDAGPSQHFICLSLFSLEFGEFRINCQFRQNTAN